MTIGWTEEIDDALVQGPFEHRTFVWIVARNRDTLEDVSDGFWNDHGLKVAEVINPDTGSAEERTFYGSGGLVQVAEIPRQLNVTVQTVSVTLSHMALRVNELLRTYDIKFAPITIFRGIYNPNTMEMVSPAYPRFVGFVDEVVITTPRQGDNGAHAVLSCVSHTQEMIRSNADTRSDASQRLRDPNDAFYQDTDVVGTWQFTWGAKQGKITAIKAPTGKRGG